VKEADLVVIAASVGQFEGIAHKIKNHLKKGSIVTDVGSVKSKILHDLEPLMPEGVSFVGGHPIAGKECSGLEGAAADLFHNARCILTPGPATQKAALSKVKSLWKSLGMRIMIMTPEEHDMVFAAVSHMPHVAAYAMVNSILDIDETLIRYGGGGLRDFTRIAMSPEELWRDICASNRDDILHALRKFSAAVSRMTGFFERSDWEGLEKEFRRAREARSRLEPD
jgi:prephenate dehydrogenase